VISEIETNSAAAYWRRMRRSAVRLLALLAVLLMPFAMAAAPAAAAHHQQMSAMPAGHCPEPDSKPVSSGALAGCTMACAAALPATDSQTLRSRPLVRTPLDPQVVASLAGIELEIATPPPRLS
jgi:hypothetical protein